MKKSNVTVTTSFSPAVAWAKQLAAAYCLLLGGLESTDAGPNPSKAEAVAQPERRRP